MEDEWHTEKEFESRLQAHRAIVFKIVNTYCWQLDDRADLAQEIAAQLWRAWPRYDPSRTFTTWMYRIAFNVAISFVRKEVQHRRTSVPLDENLHDVTPTTRSARAWMIASAAFSCLSSSRLPWTAPCCCCISRTNRRKK